MQREVKIKTTLTLRFRPILLEEHFEHSGKRYLVDEAGNRWDMTAREADVKA